jgi:hypothetical protein
VSGTYCPLRRFTGNEVCNADRLLGALKLSKVEGD